MSRLLLVDDDDALRTMLARSLRRAGYEILEAGSCARARELMSTEVLDLTVVDYNLPDGTAFDILSFVHEREAAIAVLVLTGVGTIDLAVQAIKLGAENFLTKPVDQESLNVMVERSLAAQRERRQQAASRALTARHVSRPFIGTSKAIHKLEELATAMATADAPVLILGETGAGKGVLARWLHENGKRKAEPFVDLNCGGLSREFAESELFGQQRNAATAKPGLFEIANKGTLFLDEIGDLELQVQPKLLNALEDHTFRRVGEAQTRLTDFRLLAATHKDLARMTKEEKFRQDLLYRINTLVLEVPPLRTRAEDVPLLAQELLQILAQQQNRPAPTLEREAEAMLKSYAWPGNIRELRNVLERALLFCKGSEISREALDFDRALEVAPDEDQTLDAAERRHLVSTLRRLGGRIEDASHSLGLSRSALYAKLKKYELKAADFGDG